MTGRIRAGEMVQGRVELRFVLPDGAEVFVAVHAIALAAGKGPPLVLCQLIDITEQRRVEAELAQQATVDSLTSLSTRLVFFDHVARALAHLARSSSRLVAVLFLDLDRLKYLNDT